MRRINRKIDRDLFDALFSSFLGTHILDDILTFFVNTYIAVELGDFTDAIFKQDYEQIKNSILIIVACLVVQIIVEPILFAFFSARSVHGSTRFIRKLLVNYINKPYFDIAENEAGDIPSRIENDIMSFIRERLKQAGNRIMLPVLLLYLLYLVRKCNAWYVIITFVATAVAYITPLLTRHVLAKFDADERIFNSAYGTLETELATNAYCLKSLKIENKLIEKIKGIFNSYYRTTIVKKNRCTSLIGIINSICSSFSNITIIIVGAFLAHKQLIPYGEVVTMLSLTASMTVLLQKGTELITVKPILYNLYDRLQFFYDHTSAKKNDDAAIRIDSNNIVEGYDVSMKYGDTIIFEDLSFSVPKGKITLLKGANGSGKSTLIRLICGFEYPASGEILFAGKRLQNCEASSISLVTQDSILFRYVGAKENILPDSNNAESEKIDGYLDDFLLEPIKKEQTTENFSGGEAQKTKIIRALMKDAELLILDEPENHLDSSSIECLIDCLKREKRSVLIVSHSNKFDMLADKTIFIPMTK